MFRIDLVDFRGFGNLRGIEVKPITFLVGENSAGKTSFLAGVRFLKECFSRKSSNPFNRDPYFLGGFDQIAHYRGGRRGRAKSFTLAINMERRRTINNRRTEQNIKHEFEFNKGYPQPEIATYIMTTDSGSVQFSFVEKRTKLSIKRPGDLNYTEISFEGRELPPSALVKESSHFIRFMFDELGFRFSPGMRGKDIKVPKIFESAEQYENFISEIYSAFRSSSQDLGREIFASAPVRTQPFRTYTPTEMSSSSEGSHVPLELSRMKRQSSEEWLEMKKHLEDFGKRSGLFSEFDIKMLGKGDVDPFQIVVKSQGPLMNIVDVGYGVSQVLPIIYQLRSKEKYKTYLLQQPEVHLHPRAQAELGSLLVQSISESRNQNIVVETHSDYIIDRIKFEIMKKRIRASDVTIVYFRKEHGESVASNIYVNEDGDLIDPPDGFQRIFH